MVETVRELRDDISVHCRAVSLIHTCSSTSVHLAAPASQWPSCGQCTSGWPSYTTSARRRLKQQRARIEQAQGISRINKSKRNYEEIRLKKHGWITEQVPGPESI